VSENQIAFFVVVHPDFPEEALGVCLFLHDWGFQSQFGWSDWLPVFAGCPRGRCKGGKQTQ
jgi:hypothetical protein